MPNRKTCWLRSEQTLNQTSPLLNAVKIVVAAVGLFIVAVGVLAGIGYIVQLLLLGGDPDEAAVWRDP